MRQRVVDDLAPTSVRLAHRLLVARISPDIAWISRDYAALAAGASATPP
jgi:hypothetical protein